MTAEVQFNEIVIVDDEESARVEIRAALDGVCKHFIECESGMQMIKLVDSQRWDRKPEIVLVDLGMPVMSGYDLIRRLRERFAQRVSIIVVSKMGTGNDIIEAQSAGADAFVKKPATTEKLLQAIAVSMDKVARARMVTIPYFI